jgi:hypothetical protein
MTTQPLETIEQITTRLAEAAPETPPTAPETDETPPVVESAEAPKEQPKEPKKDPQSARFGALARKEKELRNQMSEFDRKMKEFEAREQQIRERESRFSQAKRPLDALKELGYTYSDVTQDLLGGYTPPEEDPLDAKLKPHKEKWDKFEATGEALAKEVEQLKAQIALKEQKETYGQVMSEIKGVLSDADRYELTNAMGDEGLQLVQEVILEYFNQNQVLLGYGEACDIVEKYYEDDIMSRVLNTKKLKSRVAPPPPAAKPSPAPKKEVKEPTTLSNALSTGSQATVDIDKMSKQEAIEYLSKKLQFK